MKCIYRKNTRTKTVTLSTTTEQTVFEEFAECYGEDCPVYSDGKCRGLYKELGITDCGIIDTVGLAVTE